MLEKLGVSKAEYHLQLCKDNKVRVTVMFNTSTLPVEGAPVYLSMSGIESDNYEIAEDSACVQARQYVEEATKTTIKDLGYSRLVEAKEETKIMLYKLKKTHEYKKQLARGWFLSVRHMASFSKQVLNIAYLNYSGGQDSVDTVWNNLLTNFEDLGFRLRHAGAVLEKRLEQMRKDHFS
jgi:hypothetical protein